MKLYSYVVVRDFGFAPNPFYGACTLATCKPTIRRTAQVDDWIIGTGSKAKGRAGRAVFVMQVAETLTYNKYWRDPRFRQKRPNLRGSVKQAFGDNIYRRRSGKWTQENSHHSLATGKSNRLNIANDTKTDRILVGFNFAYWGGAGPLIPKRLRQEICAHRGHKSNFSDATINRFVKWFESLEPRGYLGAPLEFT